MRKRTLPLDVTWDQSMPIGAMIFLRDGAIVFRATFGLVPPDLPDCDGCQMHPRTPFISLMPVPRGPGDGLH